ncbi:MAG: hypothetical protein IT582_05290, partial [Opitutaceae bacterium]|nr:hypothetical protein [Opitutaceae bacterium]
AKSENPAASQTEINVTPGLEEKLNQFWGRNRRNLLILAVVVLVVILGRGAWDYVAAQKEATAARAYAAATTTGQKRAFAQANAGHELAGVAWLQIGDTAYAENKPADALAAYQSAAKILTTGPLASRAALGSAMAQLQAGQTDAGKAALQTLADTSSAPVALRTEAAYHLASLAHAAGDDAKLKALAQQIAQIDPASPWTQRIMLMQLAKPTASTAAPAQPAAPATTQTEEPTIKLNLGK